MHVHVELGAAPQWSPIRPDDPSRMLGGTERLALRLASLLAGTGHEVTFRGGDARGTWQGVSFLAPGEPVGAPQRVVGVMADPPADAVSARHIAWSHAAQWPHQADGWDAIVAVSAYHADLLRPRLTLPVHAIPAACDPPPLQQGRRDLFLYASSPDRGLHRLLAVWPQLFERFGRPLHVTYDLRRVLRAHAGRPDPLGARLRAISQAADQPGVIVHGPLDEARLASLRDRALALLYPLDPVLPHSELFSLSIVEACAAGVPPVLAPVDALPSVYGDVARFVEAQAPVWDAAPWLEAVEEVLADADYPARCRAFAMRRSWADFFADWTSLLEETARPSARAVPTPEGAWVFVCRDLPGVPLLRPAIEEVARRGHHLTVLTDHAPTSEALGAELPVRCVGHLPDLLDGVPKNPGRVVVTHPSTCIDLLAGLRERSGKAPLAALESGWLDHAKLDPRLQLLDLVLHALSAEEWTAPQADGIFHLPPWLADRTQPLGSWCCPSPSRGVDADRVLVDLSGFPAAHARALTEPLMAALAALRAARPELGVRWVRTDASPNEPWAEQVSGASTWGRDALIGVRCVVTAPSVPRALAAAAAGVGVLALAPGTVFRDDAIAYADRIGRALALSGICDTCYGVPTVQQLTRRLHVLLESTPAPSPGDPRRVVDRLEAMEPAPRPPVWRPPVLRG